MIETGSGLFGTTDLREIFDRLSNDPSLRYRAGRRCSSTPDASSPPPRRRRRSGSPPCPTWPATSPAVPEAEEAGMATAYYMPGVRRRLAAGDVLPEHVAAGAAPPLRGRGHRLPRSGPGPPLPAHHRHGVQGPGAGAPGALRHGLRRGLGPLRERLADEMGLYSDDLARMGLFAADAWRASRLVVDTGLHALGWSRQQAIDWMAAHTPAPPARGRDRDRPLHLVPRPGPGLHGRPARDRAPARRGGRARLGERFDLREFHDLVLRVGILPLPALARTVERWVQRLSP